MEVELTCYLKCKTKCQTAKDIFNILDKKVSNWSWAEQAINSVIHQITKFPYYFEDLQTKSMMIKISFL